MRLELMVVFTLATGCHIICTKIITTLYGARFSMTNLESVPWGLAVVADDKSSNVSLVLKAACDARKSEGRAVVGMVISQTSKQKTLDRLRNHKVPPTQA